MDIFLLKLIEVGVFLLKLVKWVEIGKLGFTNKKNRALSRAQVLIIPDMQSLVIFQNIRIPLLELIFCFSFAS